MRIRQNIKVWLTWGYMESCCLSWLVLWCIAGRNPSHGWNGVWMFCLGAVMAVKHRAAPSKLSIMQVLNIIAACVSPLSPATGEIECYKQCMLKRERERERERPQLTKQSPHYQGPTGQCWGHHALVATTAAAAHTPVPPEVDCMPLAVPVGRRITAETLRPN